MNENHPILSQIPLTSTLFPPRPVRLSYTYTPLPPSLPPTQVTQENLTAWVQECEHVKEALKQYGSREVNEYEQWQKNLTKFAPGYIGNELLTPQRKNIGAATPTGNEAVESQFAGLNIK